MQVKEKILNKSGWINEINTRKLGLLLIELGGGRKKIDDKINYHVGYNNILGIGEKVDEKTPIIKVFSNSKEAFDLLRKDENAVLIDVRTKKEHLEVGIPDLRGLGKETYLIEWKISILPGSGKRFLNDFYENLGPLEEGKYLFICRSGIRSNLAALTVEESFNSGNYNGRCFNVEDGFEGHEQPIGYQQNPTGWKNLGMPWK